jgi:hypothetical protein
VEREHARVLPGRGGTPLVASAICCQITSDRTRCARNTPRAWFPQIANAQQVYARSAQTFATASAMTSRWRFLNHMGG